jgi:hypothetical protein
MMTGIMKESFLAKPERGFWITRIGLPFLIMSLDFLAGYSGRPCRRQGWPPALLNSLVVLLVFTARNFGMALWLVFSV